MEINTWHKTDGKKVVEIMEEMEEMGSPTIRATETAYGMVALEGNHRIEAAYRLGIEPEFIVMEHDEIIENHGLQDFEGESMSVSDILEYIGTPGGKYYEF